MANPQCPMCSKKECGCVSLFDRVSKPEMEKELKRLDKLHRQLISLVKAEHKERARDILSNIIELELSIEEHCNQ